VNHKRLALIIIGISFFISMASCTTQSRSSQPTNEPPAATVSTIDGTATDVPPSGNPISATPTIDADALIREKLQNHHGIDRIFSANKTREEWNATLDRMIGYGAKISEAEKQIIIDYLLSKQ
jgi:hypothetical protein